MRLKKTKHHFKINAACFSKTRGSLHRRLKCRGRVLPADLPLPVPLVFFLHKSMTSKKTPPLPLQEDEDAVCDAATPSPISIRPHLPPQPPTKVSHKIVDEFSEEVQRCVSTAEADGQETLSLTHSVRHEVAIPANYDYVPLGEWRSPHASPARTYKFTLDPFQRVSIDCLERTESVLVSAHTSAGKTVIAEYAIAMSLRDKQRVIYTSPIKALSNQKYREFEQQFGDVGLMTGDVTINPTASCLVMTTEILRSMLYRGSEVMREVAWVIFDEVHYMRDKERGVVWEETLILLPHSVHFVFLSATIPNAKQFANWICDMHDQPCHVVYTDYRPTPLQHYLYPAGADGIFLVVDEKGTFREENFQKSLACLGEDASASANSAMDGMSMRNAKRRKEMHRGGKGSSADLFRIVQMIMAKNYHPVIVFSFSKKDCETHAMNLGKLDFNSENERELVETVFKNAIDSLNEDDQKLPQIASILPLLKRGIGIHHSGLLPILKEVIEILFQEGLLKVLFATETFSIGLNMPARTVVFTSARKFDGKTFRWISGGEYIQMSGRAGRRGLDDRGIVILMLDERMEPPVAKRMLKGQTDPLNSAFHLSYSMILNLMRVEGMSPERMLTKSFFQFQNAESLPALRDTLVSMQTEKEARFPPHASEEVFGALHHAEQTLAAMQRDLRKIVHHPSYILPFVQPGRMVRIRTLASDTAVERDFGWGCFINFKKLPPKGAAIEPTFLADVLLYVRKDAASGSVFDEVLPMPAAACNKYNAAEGAVVIVPVTFDAIDAVSTVKVHVPRDLTLVENRVNLFQNIVEIRKRFLQTAAAQAAANTLEGIPLLHPVHDLRIKDAAVGDLLEKIALLKENIAKHEARQIPDFAAAYAEFCEKMAFDAAMRAVKKQIKETTAVIHLEELKCRKRVLRRLQYTNAQDVIETKGKVACELTTGDELLLTEMMFNGVFNVLDVEEIVALLSCFVFEENSASDAAQNPLANLSSALQQAHRQLQETARRIARITVECKWTLDEEAYVASFKVGLMEVVWAWSKGAKFIQICKMTSVFEGSIIRCMKRLEELLRQMCQAARSIGNSTLESKFSEGIIKIKRDIVFANSLYL